MGKFCHEINQSHLTQNLTERLAIVTLRRNAGGKLKICRDNVDYVMYHIIKGYTKFDPNRGSSLSNYLITCAKFAVKSLLFKKRNKGNMRFISLDNNLTDSNFSVKSTVVGSQSQAENIALYNEIISYIETTPDLLDRQRQVLLLHFRDGMSLDEISTEIGILHRTYIYVLLEGGLNKVKEKFYGECE